MITMATGQLRLTNTSVKRQLAIEAAVPHLCRAIRALRSLGASRAEGISIYARVETGRRCEGGGGEKGILRFLIFLLF